MLDIVVTSPREQRVLKTIKADDKSTIQHKIARAKDMQRAWAELSIKERAQVMFAYREQLRRNTDELAKTIHQENGKTMGEAKAEVEKAMEVVDFACGMPTFLIEERLLVSRGVHCTMTHRPLGVVASITPCNFPLMIPNWTAPIAMMAGNAMVVKPSPLVPLSALMMVELLKNAGLPDGIFSVINGGQDVVEHLIAHDDIAAISFVGSTEVAKKVYRDATAQLKRALCLGSAKNYLLVLPDADVELTAENVVASAFGMAGQRCMAASAVIAVKQCDAIINRIVALAKNLKPGDDVAPIITTTNKERIEKLIAEAVNDGAKILLDGRTINIGGKTAHNYIGPTILAGVAPTMAIARTEIFGPVLSILNAATVEDALHIQNSSVYGNGASIYTQSIAMADYIKERLTAGMIGVNIGVPVPREPFSFGGIKWSKFGAGDITGKSSIAFWTNPIKCTTKWKKEDAINWMS